MKKYLIHFIYLVIIALLAVFSRMKTNELENKVTELSTIAVKQRQVAEEEAAKALAARREAEAQAQLAQEALKKCQENE